MSVRPSKPDRRKLEALLDMLPPNDKHYEVLCDSVEARLIEVFNRQQDESSRAA